MNYYTKQSDFRTNISHRIRYQFDVDQKHHILCYLCDHALQHLAETWTWATDVLAFAASIVTIIGLIVADPISVSVQLLLIPVLSPLVALIPIDSVAVALEPVTIALDVITILVSVIAVGLASAALTTVAVDLAGILFGQLDWDSEGDSAQAQD